ncbi:MAG TPA: FixH family protein [Gemmatimonadaceae bacterium]|jgi:nitrogen fixation protein FixH|nr:FixH family protein [Gemmatimonadaceae bacterium]
MKFRRGWYWPWFIVAALLFTVGVNVVMLFAASGDGGNGYVVEPDYYRKAVDWDRTMARQAASDSLGWSATATIKRGTGDSSRVVLRPVGRGGAAVTGAHVTATLIHNRDAAHPLKVVLTESEPGRYVTMAALPHAGRWEVRVEARRGAERFMTTLHAER